MAPGPVPRHAPSPVFRSAVVAVTALILGLGMNVAYTTWVVTESQHRWCTTLVTLDNADHNAPPPQTQFGRQLITDFHALRESFGCGGGPR